MNGSSPLEKKPFKFTGSAGEYFGIVFINGLLNMVTLGIYSPWAKVRTLQYLYGNSSLGNSEFHFTADPRRMLISRLIAIALFVTYLFVENFNSLQANIVYGVMFIAFLAFSPVLTIFVMSFRLRHSRWRGINFNFRNDYKGAYRVYLAPIAILALTFSLLALPFYSVEIEQKLGIDRHLEYVVDAQAMASDDMPAESVSVTNPAANQEEAADYTYANEHDQGDELSEQYAETGDYVGGEDYLEEEGEYSEEEEDTYINPYFFVPFGVFFLLFCALTPYFDFINTRFLMRNVKFGTASFTYRGNVGEFYQVYALVFVVAALVAGLFVAAAMDLVGAWLPGLGLLFAWPFTLAILKSKRYNLLFGRTSIDNDRFQICADVPLMKMFYLLITNTLGIIVSFGMLKAWAQIRTVHLLLAHTAIETQHSFDDFVAEQNEKLSAIGEEIADVFDLDLAF